MKKVLFALLLLAVATANAQNNDNPCGMHWTQMAQALSANGGAVWYAVEYPSKANCGWPKVALEHTFPYKCMVMLNLRGIGYDNKIQTSGFSAEIEPNVRYVGQGNWHTFKQVNEVVRVEVTYHKGNDYYDIIYDRDKGINETRINGKTMEEINQEKQKQQQDATNLVNEFNQNQTTFSDSYSKLNNQISQIKDPTKKAQLQNQLEQYNTRFQQLKQDATQNKSTSNTEELSKNVENIKQLNSNVQSLMSDADNAAANDNSDAQSNDQRNDDANSSSAQSADAARNKAAEEEKAKLKYQQERKEWHAQQREVQAAQETTAATNLVNGAASASDIIGNIQSNLSDRNFFNGSSTHLGINAGLISPNTPMITTTSGGYSNITSPFQLGADIGLTFHPVITDNAALKITGNFVAALDPIAFLSGDGSSTSNTSTDNMDATTISSSTAINYDFGAEVALGAKNVKAIGGYYFRHYGLSYDVSTTTDTYSGDNTTTNNFNENGSIDYNSKRMEFGLRLGDYHGTMVDLIYGLESFTDADRTSKQFPVYKISIWKFSGFKFFAEYGKGIAYGNNYLPWLNDSNSDKKGTYINVGLIYNIDWLWKW